MAKFAHILTLFQARDTIEREMYESFGIRDLGRYVEHLVAAALGAELHASGVTKGSDLFHPLYGRIEVRSRRLPYDSRGEDRAQIPLEKRGLFDHFVHVVVGTDYRVVGAYLVPHDTVERLAGISRNRYVRFREGAALADAVDLTDQLRAAQAS